MTTDAETRRLRPPPMEDLTADQRRTLLETVLQERTYQELTVPELVPEAEEQEARLEDLAALGVPAEEAAAGAEAAAAPAEEPAAPVAPLPSGPPVVNLMAASGPVAGAPAAATPPANGLPSVNLQPAAAAEAAGAAAAGAEDGLEEANLGALPLVDEAGAAQAAPAANDSVQVSTNRPVLVVPVNMAQPPPAQYYQPPAPGAPGTFAVDTSPAALAATTGQQPVAPNRGGRSRSPRGNGGPGAAAGAGAVVNVSKMGAGPNNSATPPNVRVNVMKTG